MAEAWQRCTLYTKVSEKFGKGEKRRKEEVSVRPSRREASELPKYSKASKLPKEGGASERPKEGGRVAPKERRLTVLKKMKRKEGVWKSEIVYITWRFGSTEQRE